MEDKVFFVLFFLALTGATTVRAAAGKHDWGYSDNGPAKWGDNYPICKHKKQSPINIEPCEAVHDKNLGEFTFTNFDKVPPNSTFEILNSGHSFAIDVLSMKASISGGGLAGSFNTFNFHLHWGKNDDGSEHEVNGDQYAGEIHFVHYSNKYANITEAIAKPDGLAVLGIFLKVGDKNPDFDSFLNYAVNVTKTDSKVLASPIRLDKMLPKDRSSFYRYNGSLTTPPCYESVTWTVFKDALEISQAQLGQLRTLKKSDNTTLQYNFRPVQPLNGRAVKTSFQVPGPCPTPSAATKTQALSGVLTVIFGVLALVSIVH